MKLRSNLFKKLWVVMLVLGATTANVFADDLAGPVLGDVGEDHARLWIKTLEAAKVQWIVGTDEQLTSPLVSEIINLDASQHFNATLKVEGLKPATKYFYNVTINGHHVFHQPLPIFITAPPLKTSGHMRFAFTSCLGHSAEDSNRAWKDMATQSLDMLLLLGDQHYANSTDFQVLLDQYVAYRSSPDFKAIAREKPVYAIWDDHDYGGSDVDGQLQGKERSLTIFKEVWPNPDFGQKKNPGIYYSFSRGDVDFFMLDGRYYRSPKNIEDDGTKTQLGFQQLKWLKSALKRSQAKVKIIASGVEFNGGAKADSWFFYQRERKDLLHFIINNKIEGVVFISGDGHYTAGFQMKEGFLEITSGPLGSDAAAVPNNPYLIKGFPKGHYYSILDIDTTFSQPRFTWETYGFLLDGTYVKSKCTLDWEMITRKKPIVCASSGDFDQP